MDDMPYASMEEDNSSQNADKRGGKWSKKKKKIGVAFVLLLLMFTAGVVVGICTKSNNDVPTPTSTPIIIATKTTTVIPKTTVTSSTTAAIKTTPAPKTTEMQTSARTSSTPETFRTSLTSMPTALPTSLPKSDSSCDSGSYPMFSLSFNATVGKPTKTRAANSVSECKHHCAQSEDCSVLEFHNRTCTFFEKGSKPHWDRTRKDSRVLAKSCVKSERGCPAHVEFVLYEQKILIGFVEQEVPADTIEDCFAACLNANDTFGFVCRSANYYPLDKLCFLNTESHDDHRENLIEESEDTVIVVYLENACAYITDENENGIIPCEEDTTPGFIRAPNMILVGFASFVKRDCRTVAQCLHLCANPIEHDERFVCKSAMYYYNERECVLNSENRETKPDLFIPESEDIKVDYFDVTRHINNKTCVRSTRANQETHPDAWTKLRHEDTHSAECVCI